MACRSVTVTQGNMSVNKSTTIAEALEVFQEVIERSQTQKRTALSLNAGPHSQHTQRNPKGVSVEVATHVKLYAMNPPITAMDGEELGKLKNCE